MSKMRWIAVGLLMLLAPAARAIDVTDGATGLKPGPPAFIYDGTKQRAARGTSIGEQSVLEANPLSLRTFYVPQAYFDTLGSASNSRAVDSLAVPIDVRGMRRIKLDVKISFNMDGVNRIALGIRTHSTLINDSISTRTLSKRFTKAGGDSSATALDAGSLPDSVGHIASAEVPTAASMVWPHECVLVFNKPAAPVVGWPGQWNTVTFDLPPGTVGMSFYLRLLSTANTGAPAASARTIKVRVDASGSAL